MQCNAYLFFFYFILYYLYCTRHFLRQCSLTVCEKIEYEMLAFKRAGKLLAFLAATLDFMLSRFYCCIFQICRIFVIFFWLFVTTT